MNCIAKGSQDQTIKQFQSDFTERESDKDMRKGGQLENTPKRF